MLDIHLTTDSNRISRSLLSVLIKLNDSKTSVIKAGQNFTFCKQNYKFNKRIKQYVRKLSREIIKRSKRKIVKLKGLREKDKIDDKEYIANTRCIVGMIKSKPNTKKDIEMLTALMAT